MSSILEELKREVESDLDHFMRTFNLPRKYRYKYTDGSGATGYIVTETPISMGSGKALNVHIFGDGIREAGGEKE